MRLEVQPARGWKGAAEGKAGLPEELFPENVCIWATAGDFMPKLLGICGEIPIMNLGQGFLMESTETQLIACKSTTPSSSF